MTYANQLIFIIATLFTRENKGLPRAITVVAFIDLTIEKMLSILLQIAIERLLQLKLILVFIDSLKQELLDHLLIIICCGLGLVSAQVHMVEEGMSGLDLIFIKKISLDQLGHQVVISPIFVHLILTI